MIQIENLTKSYGADTILDNVSFQINKFEKVGLIGRNGSGKTTLFRIITGEEEATSGKMSIPRDYRIGYVKQEINFTQDTSLAEGSLGLPNGEKDETWRVERLLYGLGFTKDLVDLNPTLLSGGFQVRLNLAKTLLTDSNMLLLDEPTNYLDITSIRFLINFLKEWKGELFLITHDRSFMDEVVTHTAAIHRNRIKKISGNTEKLYLQIAKEEEIYEKQRINEESRRKKDEIFINRFRAKARLAGLIQSRIKMLEKHDKKEKLEKIKSLDFRFNYSYFEPQRLMDIENLNFSYDKNTPLIEDLDFKINKNDRIAVIGPNGRGKSTLLRLLSGEIQPDVGVIKSHSLLRQGFFSEANKSLLHSENTVEEEIMLSCPDNSQQRARDICGVLMFRQDEALKKISILSGGEKSRVLLGKILASSVNLLLLDEPTNHLDMESADALLAAIDDFEGAVVIVTHNQMYLNAIPEKLIIFDDDRVFTFKGRYNEFLEKIGWSSEKDEASKNLNRESVEKTEIREIKKIKAELIEEKSKKIRPVEKKCRDMENRIALLENDLAELNEKLLGYSRLNNGIAIGETSKKIHETESVINGLYDELDMAIAEFEAIRRDYDEKIDSLSQENVSFL